MKALRWIVCVLYSFAPAVVFAQTGSLVPMADQAPELLTYEELVILSDNPYPMGELRRKYNRLWEVPIVSNAATRNGIKPKRPESPEIGPFVRVLSWNIEKSLRIDEAITTFTDEESYQALLDPRKAKPGSKRHKKALRERQLLADADIILLQEMEIGVKRSNYRNAAKDLALALGMNYAFLPEYIEVDPVILGLESIRFKGGQQDEEAEAYYRVDPQRYKGLFGVAVLSRYPIIRAEGFRLFHQGYDWYWQEKQKTSYMEKLRRFGAEKVFAEQQTREMKVGGRSFFRVDLHIPELPEQVVSVINVHLEIKCQPRTRTEQMAEILNYIREIDHPVILAGDFNSAPMDLSPTSSPRVVARILNAPEFWFSRAIDAFLPQALIFKTLRSISNLTKNYQNPTAWHIPLLAPNRVGEMFAMIMRFRFGDGTVFDCRGDRRRSSNNKGKLSNSNERDLKGYETTFKTNRTLGNLIGKYRLDWMFVKPYINHPKKRGQSYWFAPHFGRTLSAINMYLKQPISDHNPNIVDLPLQEPLPIEKWPKRKR